MTEVHCRGFEKFPPTLQKAIMEMVQLAAIAYSMSETDYNKTSNLAKEAEAAHVLLNELGVPNVNSESKPWRFFTVVERIELLNERKILSTKFGR